MRSCIQVFKQFYSILTHLRIHLLFSFPPCSITSNLLSNIIHMEDNKMLVPSTGNAGAARDWKPYLNIDVHWLTKSNTSVHQKEKEVFHC